jgi:hypothetical protein
MVRCLVSVLFVAQVVADGPQTAPPESGMTSIFNDKDLTGWDGDPRLWSVRDGVIHGQITSDVSTIDNTFLVWTGGRTSN